MAAVWHDLVMDDVPPSWTELLGRIAAVSFGSATGKIWWKYIGHGGEVSEGVNTFWFRRGGDMRIDGSVGMMMLQAEGSTLMRDPSGKMQIHEGNITWRGPGDPNELLGGRDAVERFSDPYGFSVPRGPGLPIEIDGRPGWEFILDPPEHKPHGLKVVIDDATAVVLEMRSVGVDTYATLTSFEPDVAIADSVFVYDGPVATDEREGTVRRQRVGELEREMRWPSPRYWPTGMEMHLIDADPDTGAFIGRLDNRSGAILARWPEGDAEPPDLARYQPNFHVHHWTANGFDWALAVEAPFSPQELQRIIASIPADPEPLTGRTK